MQIHGRDWCNLYYWSEEGGSCLAHIRRDDTYWALLYEVWGLGFVARWVDGAVCWLDGVGAWMGRVMGPCV